MAEMSKVDRLHEADVIKKEDLNEDEKKAIEQMSEHEVTVLIGMRKRLGAVKPGRERIKPNVPL